MQQMGREHDGDAVAAPEALNQLQNLRLPFGIETIGGFIQQEVEPRRLARVASIDLLLSLCLMPAGQLLAGPISNAIGVDATLILAGTLMCVPNFLVLLLVPEVRSVRRREAEAEPEREPALSAL